MTEEEKQYLPLLRSRLRPERYVHSLGVAETAGRLAERYGTDVRKARLAGLLHDVTKNLTAEEQREWLRKTGEDANDGLMRSPGVWHAVTGAYFVRDELGLTDEDIFRMIYWHTSGHAGMKTDEKTVYVADFVEPNRKYPGVESLRNLAFRNLDAAALEGVSFCLIENVKKNKFIYEATMAFYNDLVGGERI